MRRRRTEILYKKEGEAGPVTRLRTLRRTAVILLVTIGYAASFGALFYPTVSNLMNQYRQRKAARFYEQAARGISGEKRRAILKEARAYNRQHRRNYIKDAFDTEEEYVLEHPYDQLLNPAGNQIMGYIEIPKIGITLSIHHGIGKQALEEGCGHIEGTSLPVGGKGNHAVLAAHRGLPNARLFTDLDQMVKGDEFYLHVLGQVLAYRVDRIRVVLPEKTEALSIQEGRDLVTLLTCTPYGVNTHRLLVRGHRVRYDPAKERAQAAQADPPVPYYLVALAAGVLALLLFAFRSRKRNRGLRS